MAINSDWSEHQMIRIELNGKIIVVSIDEFVRLCKKRIRLKVLGKVESPALHKG